MGKIDSQYAEFLRRVSEASERGEDVEEEMLVEYNKDLVSAFPFLRPVRFSSAGDECEKYDYTYTELDDMPFGWRLAFGEQMCKEIYDELEKNNCVDTYRIVQIKEKFGALRWYDNGGTDKIEREIIPKYEDISERTCIACGAPATKISTGWIMPFCDRCAPEGSIDIGGDESE